MSCDLGKATVGLKNALCSFSNLFITSPTSQLILQPFVGSPTLQLILQPFFRFSYVAGSSLTSPGVPPMTFSPGRNLSVKFPRILIKLKVVFVFNVCVPMPTHCTITCFGFRARRIVGVECGLFSIHAPLGQATLRVGRISVQCTGGSRG